MLLVAMTAQAQVNISGKVFGGARQANVGGHTFVEIKAEKHDVVIDAVYGGNDIAGTIGSSTKPAGVDDDQHIENLNTYNAFVRTDAEASGKHLFIGQLFGGGYGNYTYDKINSGNNSGKYNVSVPLTVWNSEANNGAGAYEKQSITFSAIDKPELDRTYVDLHGGTFGYVFGGGDNVTVKDVTHICINNTSTRTKTADETDGLALLTTQRLNDMGINTEYFNKQANHVAGVDKFLFSRVFGGNNKADMRIMPKWHLQAGSIENLYSGGNEGRMTSDKGLLLEIGSSTVASNINIYNVYGGCRKADVCPETSNGAPAGHVRNLTGYKFPPELAARTLVRSGKIHNVYGGNDVRGRVYFGNAVGIYTSISGNVYGGGNGSYPYTDNKDLADDPVYGDFYYNPITELGLLTTTFTPLQSAQALNLVRPNAEQVSIRIAGEANADGSMKKEVIIGGDVYCGGNSATLKLDPDHAGDPANEVPAISNNYPLVELKVGSHIKIDRVFLGNNGENMVNQSTNGLLAQYAGSVTPTAGGDPIDFSTMDLTDSDVFKEYMKGCAMDIIPSINFDDKEVNLDPATYVDYTAYIGSLFCGGNVGSMTYNDVKSLNFNRKLVIFDKLVGGCNNAIIPKTAYNAYYAGGIIGTPNATTGNKVELTISGLKIEPKRWKVLRDNNDYNSKVLDVNGNVQYVLDSNGNRQLEWNTIYASTGKETPAITDAVTYDTGKDYKTSDDYDLDRRFTHGHIYGGCYTSGIVNGNVVINIDGHIMEREKLFDVVKTDNLGEEESLYGQDQTQQERFKITERKTGVLLGQQGMDVLGAALNVFGGGKGKATEIWGSTTINLNRGYTFQVFGGSEEGIIGKRQTVKQDDIAINLGPDAPTGEGDYTYSYELKEIGTDEVHTMVKTYQYNPAYSCYVNLKGQNAGVSKKDDHSENMAECEFMYGGGFFGPICGNTYVNLGRGRIFNSFAGSCNADILGHTETYIGRQIKDKEDGGIDYSMAMFKYENVADNTKFKEGFPWVRDYTYGGNDLGGLIMQAVDFSGKVPANYITSEKIHKKNTTSVLTANAYTEYLQGRAEGIFGGCYGTYDYTDTKFHAYFDANGDPIGNNHKPYMVNAFVNFKPTYTQSNNLVNKIYGAGQGQPGEKDRDNLQDRSYVLIDVPQDMAYYKDMEVFGAGAWGGVGMKTFLDPKTTADATLDGHSTIIDLVRGQIGAAYGGSYAEGITRRTVINVPEQSTINIKNIFGGAYGTQILPPCDVYESNVNYNNTSEEARVTGKIYGGNNSERRTLYTHVNISSPVWSDKDKGYLSTVYGAGRGLDTWSEYTEVNLLDGAKVYEVYGGGEEGHVLNAESVQTYMKTYQDKPSSQISTDDPNWKQSERWVNGTVGGTLKDDWKDDWAVDWKNAWKIGPTYPGGEKYFVPDANYANYIDNTNTNLTNTGLVRTAEMDDRDYSDLTATEKAKKYKLYNTNVIIHKGAQVVNYAYGGGWGKVTLPLSGDVYGETYIALLGGTVKKDIYAAGTSGSVDDLFGVGARSSSNPNGGFTATANAYIEGGSCRNVYGGGWNGSVGRHVGGATPIYDKDGKVTNAVEVISGPFTGDVPGETHVVIGRLKEDLGTVPATWTESARTASEYYFYNGIPTVQRNAYGGGEGGPIYGTAHITLNNGYIGYQYNASGTDNDKTAIDERYEEKIIDDTYKDTDGHFVANQNLYDSGCIFGGGYIDNSSVDITKVKMFDGHVRNALFGGGEIAAIGRGKIIASGTDNSVRSLDEIYKAGKTNIELFGGHVHRNVFGGGRGYNNLGDHGTLFSDGYVFGQTEVHVHGGEIGTEAGLAMEYGNVFGGGDIGYVYSAYEYVENGTKKLGRGMKKGVRYDDGQEGYYYRNKGSNGTFTNDANFEMSGSEYIPTEDCKVLIEPWTKVTGSDPVSFTGIHYGKGHVVSSVDLAYLKANSNTSGIDPTTGKVTADGGKTFSRSYAKGEYVPTYALNTLGNKNADSKWKSLDSTGVIIHNAVFAGGNTASGSATVYANTTSVFGNATASLHDAYHRDLITLGTGHIGGLYGDGNLTFVDGYRGLNITNYGTDYYSIKKEVTIKEYHALAAREAAYYELKYKCIKDCVDKDGTQYKKETTDGGVTTKASTINADDLLMLFAGVTDNGVPIVIEDPDNPGQMKPNPVYWQESGVLPVYAGRLMNSIQRADFCGVFGSRMVLQGAQDRVPEVADYTNYTINRVREVSLNQQHSVISGDLAVKSGTSTTSEPNLDDYVDLDKAIHGNYFGIYNIVNFLGALTSDVHFTDRRETGNTSNEAYAENDQTYYEWKSTYHKDRKRNNGSSLNKVALASGVYLELTNENGRGTTLDTKEWGYITGIIELDLINVQTGIGGGFVYAKNEHRTNTYSKNEHATLTALNADAVTRKDFVYTGNSEVEWETSGNFVHSTQTIIDDCYNISGKYKGDDKVPAHYWYIKGSVYVYDQYISAYTGAPNAYSEKVEIPLTITAASHGTMKLLDVQPNLYAYYSSYNTGTNSGTALAEGKKMIINDVEYTKNAPISYWDWYLLSKYEKPLFIPETYVTVEKCKIGNTIYPAGYVMRPNDYTSLRSQATSQTIDGKQVLAVQKVIEDEDGNDVVQTDEDGNPVYKPFDYVFRESNNLSHDTGYILTYQVNNPTEWDTWHTEINNADHDSDVAREKNQTGGTDYEDGPTYHLKESVGAGSVLGQREYKKGDIISNDVETKYNAIPAANKPTTGQATFERAWIVTSQIVTDNGNLNPGTTLSKTEAGNTNYSGKVAEAYVCTSTIKLSQTEYIYLNTKMTLAEKTAYYNRFKEGTEVEKLIAKDINDLIVPAYYCTKPGLYGGDYYVSGKNYRGLEAWSSMSQADREKFAFNYDALDLLIDPTYSGKGDQKEGKKYQYDGEDANGNGFTTESQAATNPAGYSLVKHVDYTAEYIGNGEISYTADNNTSTTTTARKTLSRTEFERLTNEQRHYTPISPRAEDNWKVYVVKAPFQVGSSPYAVGQSISASEYSGLSDSDKACVEILPFQQTDAGTTWYYCRESYTIPADGHAVNSIMGTQAGTYAKGATVPLGAVIEGTSSVASYTGYASLTNNQKEFTIHGIAPTERSTFYVSRNSDIFDLSTEKIITVIYQYDYEESDVSGNVTPVSERHVLNIHITFKSGVPTVPDIKAPGLVLPGTVIGLREPVPTPGAYEITGGGWELFEKKSDAESHTNAIDYAMSDPLYWYQDGYYLAYYAKTYLGKTYSNYVPVSVANYHDLKKVMETANHYHIDKPYQKRDPKIYINDYSGDATGSKNGLDLLKSLVDLSYNKTDAVSTYTAFETPDNVTGAGNLEIILRTDVDHKGTPWTPIANENGECFSGTLHGDGHHLRGLEPATGTTGSLINHLCGEVYNLGVSGSFTGAGIAETGAGYVENCWVKTTGTPVLGEGHYAVFGNPTRDAEDKRGPVQVVNSYYPVSNNYQTPPAGDSYKHGRPTQMPDKSFYNGEVAYDLNGFYLKKRFYHGTHLGAGEGVTEYDYLELGDDGILTETDRMKPGYYPNTYALYQPVGTPKTPYLGYVESRFYDGDFRYAAGKIPDDVEPRLRIVEENDASGNKVEKTYFPPVWPDDYLYFGQTLSYGYDTRTHQDVPSSYDTANRVLRAPAYFRSWDMNVAHFNPDAVLTATEKLTTEQISANTTAREAYKNMTAIDFTGYNDADRNYGYLEGWSKWSKTSQQAQSEGKSGEAYAFFPPLLDDGVLSGGLSSIVIGDLTQNMLVYTDVPGGIGSSATLTGPQKTGNVVSNYLTDASYADHETNSTSHTVAAWDSYANAMHGHWVYKSANGYTTDRDHYLVDKQDFNAPMAYTFQENQRMWHQRLPENYVDRKKGWEAISLPFSAEIVTTNKKGEITHFYDGSYDFFDKDQGKKDGTDTKVGHEYWLREFTGVKEGSDPVVANFKYPAVQGDGSDIMSSKTVDNTFLWDYYYKGEGHSQQDHNTDKYQEYYSGSRTYEKYPLLTKAIPYIIGFPGVTYYEFDLSGGFIAGTTAETKPDPDKVGKQTITFASPLGTSIGVSDSEMGGVTKKYGSTNYTFKPNYLNKSFEANTNNYTLQAEYDSDNDNVTDISRFAKVPTTGEATPVAAFRPYFTAAAASDARPVTRSIIFSNDDSEIKGVVERGDPSKEEAAGTLNIYAGRKKIIVESALTYTTDVRIVNLAGITINSFTIEPGETVETRVNTSGVYIVQPSEARFVKKLSVK